MTDFGEKIIKTVCSVCYCGCGVLAHAKDGKDQIRRIMNATLIWNHHAMYPDAPIEFLARLKRNLEEPGTYLRRELLNE